MDQFHGVGCRERQHAREHLVKGHAAGIEIAAGIDRPVHAAGLLGRHVGERPRDPLRRSRGLAFARQAGRNAETRQPHAAGCGVHKDIRRLEVLVDQPLRVHPTDHSRKRDGNTQELRHVHRTTKHSLQRLAPGVFEHQRQPTLATNKLDGPRRPLGVEVGSESVFMLEPLERLGEGYSSEQATRRIGSRRSLTPRCSVN